MTFTLKSLASQCDPHFVDLLVSGEWGTECYVNKRKKLDLCYGWGKGGGKQSSGTLLGLGNVDWTS